MVKPLSRIGNGRKGIRKHSVWELRSLKCLEHFFTMLKNYIALQNI
jgi:hypothetical protein